MAAVAQLSGRRKDPVVGRAASPRQTVRRSSSPAPWEAATRSPRGKATGYGGQCSNTAAGLLSGSPRGPTQSPQKRRSFPAASSATHHPITPPPTAKPRPTSHPPVWAGGPRGPTAPWAQHGSAGATAERRRSAPQVTRAPDRQTGRARQTYRDPARRPSAPAPWERLQQLKDRGKAQGDPFGASVRRTETAEIHVMRCDSPRAGVQLRVSAGRGKGKRTGDPFDSPQSQLAATPRASPRNSTAQRGIRTRDPFSGSPARVRERPAVYNSVPGGGGALCPADLGRRKVMPGVTYGSPGRVAGRPSSSRSSPAGRRPGDPYEHAPARGRSARSMTLAADANGSLQMSASNGGLRVPHRSLAAKAGQNVASALTPARRTAASRGNSPSTASVSSLCTARNGSPLKRAAGTHSPARRDTGKAPWNKTDAKAAPRGRSPVPSAVLSKAWKVGGTAKGVVSAEDWVAL
eukprot:TRINITY_DN4023_c2_g1_i1.p1 TRINITY_DN4023_c2_g1~~TRINITY_DN4023_c2_g1_i1.p1  ORF type:complete len:486 (+),score=51.29 TRINITY_DN4023_c2_g1_i1:71-1459(+)